MGFRLEFMRRIVTEPDDTVIDLNLVGVPLTVPMAVLEGLDGDMVDVTRVEFSGGERGGGCSMPIGEECGNGIYRYYS